MERQQPRQQTQPLTRTREIEGTREGLQVINLDRPTGQRRTVVPRVDPNNLMPPGDLDDPTPPFTKEIMGVVYQESSRFRLLRLMVEREILLTM